MFRVLGLGGFGPVWVKGLRVWVKGFGAAVVLFTVMGRRDVY